MVEESSPPSHPAAESIEAEAATALEPKPESGERATEPTGDFSFVCDCEKEWMRSACKGLPFYRELETRRYCVLHYPGKEKSADFKALLESKLNNKDFHFGGGWFPDEANFRHYEFTAVADFSSVSFRAAADFSSARFSGDAYFMLTKFSADASFCYATFSTVASFRDATFITAAYFISTRFSGEADFISAEFRAEASFIDAAFSANAKFLFARFRADAMFIDATFCAEAYFEPFFLPARADFGGASFCDSFRFFGTSLMSTVPRKALSLNFQHTKIEHPERIAFHTLNLRPHWFVNVDPREFVFIDISWDRISIKQEIMALESKRVSSPNRLLTIACRQLAQNAEQNNRYEEASNFRYWAMDLARLIKWKGWSFWKTDWLHMVYWAVSGYGERILRAFGVLAAVWFVCVLLYTQVGFVQQPLSNQAASSAMAAAMTIDDRIGQPLEFSRSLTYSFAVMSLQKPEPKPLTGTAQTLVLLETILGPVQAALLALAIRRKFMR